MPYRIEKVNQLIRNEISELIRLHVKDPRLSNFVSINKVETAADFTTAKIFVSCINGSDDKVETITALEKAKGYFRRELANNLDLRHTPDLIFKWDDSIEQGAHIIDIIDRIHAEHEGS
ncbi:30S ribosome-binding factor RbfA [Chloroflexota bacterium]